MLGPEAVRWTSVRRNLLMLRTTVVGTDLFTSATFRVRSVQVLYEPNANKLVVLPSLAGMVMRSRSMRQSVAIPYGRYLNRVNISQPRPGVRDPTAGVFNHAILSVVISGIWWPALVRGSGFRLLQISIYAPQNILRYLLFVNCGYCILLPDWMET